MPTWESLISMARNKSEEAIETLLISRVYLTRKRKGMERKRGSTGGLRGEKKTNWSEEETRQTNTVVREGERGGGRGRKKEGPGKGKVVCIWRASRVCSSVSEIEVIIAKYIWKRGKSKQSLER